MYLFLYLRYDCRMATFVHTKSGTWKAIVRKNGGYRSKTFRLKRLAQKWAAEIENDDRPASRKTVGDILSRYREEVTPRKRSINREHSKLSILADGLGDIKIMDLTPSHILAFADARSSTVSGDTIKRDLATLSHVLEVAKNIWGYPVENHCVQVRGMMRHAKVIGAGVSRDRRVTDAEIADMIAVAAGIIADIIPFAVETGMRRGEIAAIRPEHLAGISLRIPITKTGKPRVIPLSMRAREILAAHGGSFGVKPDSITQAFERVAKRAGLSDVRFHDLRHEAASRLFEKGLGIEEVASITGHADWRSLKRYTHPSIEAIAAKL